MKQNLSGFFPGMSSEDYHKHSAIGSSTISRAARSSWAHAKTPMEPTDSLELGSGFHALIGEPTLFDKLYTKVPEGMVRNAAHAKYKEFLEANKGKTILTATQWAQLDGMLNSILKHNLALNLLRGGQDELSGFWIDPDTGVACKCRPDKLRENDVIVDLKTAADASASKFQRSLVDFGRHIQTAFYLDGCSVITGRKFTNFVHLVVESKPPYAVAIYALDDDSIDQGRREYKALLKQYAFCQKLDHYPAYPEEVQTVSLPNWAVKYE